MSSNTIVNKTIAINAAPASIWNTLTTPEIIKVWLSETEIDIITDFKVGNPIIFAGKWNDKVYEDKGTVLKFNPEKVFAYTYWTKISRLPDTPENYTTIEFELTPNESNTLLSVTHSNLIAETAYEHSNYYWAVTLEVIKKMVESGTKNLQ